jgi:hypothetical protein
MTDRLPALIGPLAFARGYTVALLDTIPQTEWFTMPPGCPSHVAWQVGHLAIAEAWLVLNRVCGRNSVDEGVIPAAFVTLFGRKSVAEPDPTMYPAVTELREVFDRIHATITEAVPLLADIDLSAESSGPPHPLCKTKGEFLRWVAHHEMSHAGQIGLIRRMLGQSPRW